MPPNAVTTPFTRDFFVLAPEIVLAVWGLVVLLVDIGWFRKKTGPERRQAIGGLTLAGTFLALLTALLPILIRTGLFSNLGYDSLQTSLNFAWIDSQSDPDPALFFGTISGDLLTEWFNLLFVILLALVVRMSMAWSFTEDWGEYYALLLWSTVGMMLLTAAEELLTLFLTLETMTICLYLCTAFEKDKRRSAEGGLKYFVYGSVSSALFLFGLSLVYGLTGTTQLSAIRHAIQPVREIDYGLMNNVAGVTAVLLMLVGFGFKIAAVPFHQWAPDAYEGAPAPVTAWVATGSKMASFVALMKVLIHGLEPWSSGYSSVASPGWIGIVVVLAAASMTYGNFAALAQRNLKRMLAYSSIAHAGYMLVGVAAAGLSARHEESAGSVLYYLVIYAFSNIGAFAGAAWLARDLKSDNIDDLNGLGLQYPGLATCILLLMLSLIGMPPLAGFFGKLYMFMEALNEKNPGHLTLTWLVGLGLLNSVVSAFYYVRVLKAMFLRPPGNRVVGPAPSAVALPIGLATLVVVVFGIYPAPLVDTMKAAALPMLADSGLVSTSGLAGAIEYRARMRPTVYHPGPAPDVAPPPPGGAPTPPPPPPGGPMMKSMMQGGPMMKGMPGGPMMKGMPGGGMRKGAASKGSGGTPKSGGRGRPPGAGGPPAKSESANKDASKKAADTPKSP